MSDVNAIIEQRAGRYKDRHKAKLFAFLVLNPPLLESPERPGVVMRRTGSNSYYPFWRGYDGVAFPAEPTSVIHVGYMAGKFRKEMEGKGLLPALSDIVSKHPDGEPVTSTGVENIPGMR